MIRNAFPLEGMKLALGLKGRGDPAVASPVDLAKLKLHFQNSPLPPAPPPAPHGVWLGWATGRLQEALQVTEKQQPRSFSPWEVHAQGPGSVAAALIVLIYGGWSEGLSWVAPANADSALLTPGWGRLSSITKNASFSCKTSPCWSLK